MPQGFMIPRDDFTTTSIPSRELRYNLHIRYLANLKITKTQRQFDIIVRFEFLCVKNSQIIAYR